MTEAGGADGAQHFRAERQLPPEITLSKEIDLTGKAAIVTGGSQGIGRCIVIKLAYHGADVMFNSRESSRSQAEEVAETVRSFGGNAIYYPGDITLQETRLGLAKAAVDNFGRIDILVNNAGAPRDNLSIKMTEEEWDYAVDLNMKAPFFMTQAVLRQMSKQGGGQIINISSTAGAIGTPGQANYGGAKEGMESSQRSIAREMAKRGIRVNSISLGVVDTRLTQGLTNKQRQDFYDMTTTKEAVRAEEAADLVAYIASGRLPSLTTQTIYLDGGSIK